MAIYNTPGVYIEEISTLPASIAAVETAIPAFIGHTAIIADGDDADGLLYNPKRITSLIDYHAVFGGPNNEDISITIDDELDSTDTLISRSIRASLGLPSPYKMYYSVRMFFNNGGGPCYIVSVGDYGDTISEGDGTTA